MSTTTKKTVVLSKTADWDAWISFETGRIRGTDRASIHHACLNPTTYNAYRARKDFYKTDLALYEQQQKAFGDIISFIQETIAAHNLGTGS
ncbi:hypothetical protein MMC07_005006 [Pseudocyphellaria aurata]|nr:hypothetical protein [Pseudocyphellaria aurata]